MGIWFEGSIPIDRSLQDVRAALADHGAFHAGVTRHMPGLSRVDLVDEGPDWVSIKTNEGKMERTRIKVSDDGQLVLEFDESYDAGVVRASSQARQEFVADGDGVVFKMTLSEVAAPGLLGFLYRKLGSRNIGRSILRATKAFLEETG